MNKLIYKILILFLFSTSIVRADLLLLGAIAEDIEQNEDIQRLKNEVRKLKSIPKTPFQALNQSVQNKINDSIKNKNSQLILQPEGFSQNQLKQLKTIYQNKGYSVSITENKITFNLQKEVEQKKSSDHIDNFVAIIILTLVGLFIIIPFLFIVFKSIKSRAEKRLFNKILDGEKELYENLSQEERKRFNIYSLEKMKRHLHQDIINDFNRKSNS